MTNDDMKADRWIGWSFWVGGLLLETLLVVGIWLSRRALALDCGHWPAFLCLVLPFYSVCIIICFCSPASKTIQAFCRDQILLPVIPAIGILCSPWIAFKVFRYCVKHQLNVLDGLGNLPLLPLPMIFRIVLWVVIVLVAVSRLAGGVWCYRTWRGKSTGETSINRRRIWRRIEICLDVAFLLVGLTIAANWLIPRNLENLGQGFCSIPFYLMLLVDAGWLIYCLSSFARKRIVAALGFVVLFVCGCVLYLGVPVDDTAESMEVYERQLAAPNRTIASFFPSRGGYESVTRPTARYCYFLFHSVVLFYIALLTFAFFGQSLVNILEHWFCWHRRLNVFWGRGDAGILLARSILRTTNDQRVFFCLPGSSIDGDDQKSVTADLDDMKASWIFSDRAESVTAEVANDALVQAKGFRHFFLEGKGHVNVSRADRLVQLLQTYNKQCNQTDNRQDKQSSLGILLWRAIVAGQVLWWGWSAWKTLFDGRGDGTEKGKVKFRKGILENLQKPYFYVRIEAAADEQAYLHWAENVKDWVRPVIVRESKLIARHLSRKYPLLEMPGIEIDHDNAFVKGRIKILLLGFGACGRDVLTELVCNGQYLSGENGACVPFSVDIVEKSKEVCDDFQNECPEACSEYKISFLNMSVWEKTFDEWFGAYLDRVGKNREEAYSRIVVCAGGDEENVSIASHLCDFARRHGTPLGGSGQAVGTNCVFVKVSDPARARYASKIPMFQTFGALDKVYSYNLIETEQVDRSAMLINYCRKCADAQWKDVRSYRDKVVVDAWEKLDFPIRFARRAAAESMRNILALLGYESSADKTKPEVTEADIGSRLLDGKGPTKLAKTLAETEHLQWMAFMRMHGVRLWDVFAPRDTFPKWLNDKIAKKEEIDPNQGKAWERHANLVPFEKLPDVDRQLAKLNGKDKAESSSEAKSPPPAQELDYRFCQRLTSIAEKMGERIVKKEGRRG